MMSDDRIIALKLISAYDEYLKFLNSANENAITIAWCHGWRASAEQIKKGKQFRAKIKKLKKELGGHK